MFRMSWLTAAGVLLLPAPALAAGHEPLHVPAWSVAPFVLLLAGIALLPLFVPHFWHSELNRALFTAALTVPTAGWLLWQMRDTDGESGRRLLHAGLEYVSFILMLTALYAVSGGILVRGRLKGGPVTNTAILAVGVVLANVIGTTGASMLMVRPVLRANAGRAHRHHVPVFFIFSVCNLGGLLTPLGDPPLFLGFLQGVGFFWTLALWPQWLLANGLVLVVFFLYDWRMARRERPESAPTAAADETPGVRGLGLNGPLLLATVGAVLLQAEQFSPFRSAEARFLVSNLALAAVVLASWWYTPAALRKENGFAWAPMVEVATLFAGIFVTMVPALALLETRGPRLGVTEPWQFFWLTGMLSAVLDNAPTYLTFATLAAGGHDLPWLVANRPDLLAAVSSGAVFMGALTYIGNGPNFMVKALADAAGYRMPSFLGYLQYSTAVLLPVFGAVTLVFFRG
jgi:Na+/H+ antiporter NhaD/arsenite permease-like protein